eukprot:SAG22_NODE_7277_length_755_cov_1.236280_1_plen_88_part_00
MVVGLVKEDSLVKEGSLVKERLGEELIGSASGSERTGWVWESRPGRSAHQLMFAISSAIGAFGSAFRGATIHGKQKKSPLSWASAWK